MVDHDGLDPASGDGPAGTAGMVVGPPTGPGDHPSPATADHEPRGERAPAIPTRRWWVVVVVVVVAAAGLLLLARSSPRPEVFVHEWRDDAWSPAAAAPAGPIAQRWSHALPSDRELLGLAVVDAHVVVASRDRRTSVDGDRVVVEALATLDGSTAWRREVPGWWTLVAVAGPDGTHVLANVGGDGDPSGRWFWGRTGLTVLDPTTGEVRWSTALTRESEVERLAGGDLIVASDDGVALHDPLSGAIRLSWPSVATEVDGRVAQRRAHRDAAAWVVPTREGWEIADESGDVEFAIDGAEAWPSVTEDVVVAADESRIAVHRRPGGELAWQVGFDDPVLYVQLLDRNEREPGDPVRIAVHLAGGEGEDEREVMAQRAVLVTDGRVVGPWEPPDGGLPPSWARLRVTVDGQRLVACRTLPSGLLGPDQGNPCPADLALLDDTGTVVATAPATPLDAVVPSMLPASWEATDAGLVVVGPEGVALHGWADLARTWQVDLPAGATDDDVPATVDTGPAGIAIAVPTSDPPRVTWHG